MIGFFFTKNILLFFDKITKNFVLSFFSMKIKKNCIIG